MKRALSLAWILITLLLLAGCNVIALKQSELEGTMRAAGMRAHDQRAGTDSLHYWIGGSGPTVVLVHGFGASAIWQWADQVSDLARDHRLIVPDLLWFGDSLSDDRGFGIDHQVRALEALLDHLGDRQIDVVGISYGGLVAHELASDRVGQVRRLVLVDTPGRAYTRDDYRELCGRMGVADLGQVLVPGDAAGVKRLLGLAYFDPPWVPAFALEQTLTALYTPHRDEKAALLEALLRDMDGVKARPVTLRAPAMVIWGREDPVFPLAIGERLSAGLHAPLRIVEQAHHTPNIEHPAEFNRLLRAFVDPG